MKTIKILQHPIYPDFDRFNSKELQQFISPYIQKLDFLFDDGLEITCSDHISVKPCPGDLSFFDDMGIRLTITETFNKIIFQKPGGQTLDVPILENIKLNIPGL